VRTDHALHSGAEISPFYDSMIAKVIAHAATRDEARERLARALDATVALGVPTNKALLGAVLRDVEFIRGPTTAFLDRFAIATGEPDAATLAIATALFAATAGFGEWNAWSNNPARAMRAKFADRDVILHHSGDAWQAEVDQTSVVLRILSVDPPHARIALDGAEEAVTFLIESDTIHLARGGAGHSLENTVHAAPARRAAGPADGRLIAPMNGRVVAVNAQPGDTAEAGRALVVLEAMKMEHVLSVPAAARVKAVHVAAGVQVSPGQLLVELEPS
jgi:geranyl-CoA carboxylase alpha subunit